MPLAMAVETSCEVTVEAVENLLGGQEIDQYLAMGLDGISTLNDLARRCDRDAGG